MPDQPSVDIASLSKRFGDVAAVDAVSLQIRKGEFFSLLGPSGCGKTTLLRMIAGLELPTSGLLCIDGQDMTHVPAYRRPVNMVFQHYALFPHLSVAQNVAFGLGYKGIPASDHARLATAALDLVRLSGLQARKPSQLSGGQRQRVALARALVLQPRVLLLDEPLGALDQKLRKEMQVELKNLQRELGMTFVFVTHDQEEALTMSDRIAVMNGGHVEQLDAAATVFERPRTAFVAEFMGAANFFTGRLQSAAGEQFTLACDGGFPMLLNAAGPAASGIPGIPGTSPTLANQGDSIRFIVRPEKLALHARQSSAPADPRTPWLQVTIEQRIYQGLSTVWIVRGPAEQRLTIYEQNDRPFADNNALRPGSQAHVSWHADHAVILHAPTAPQTDAAGRPSQAAPASAATAGNQVNAAQTSEPSNV